ncbi:hypothetical protein BsWGS_11531 [Bradybaena similaris]
MYGLFEFARLLSVKSPQSTLTRRKIDIKKFAWKEEGEVSLMALLCSNDYILLHYNSTDRPPIIKQLPWFHEKPVGFMCFDPTLTWLLLVTEAAQEIFIIPALSIVDSSAIVNQVFKTDDVTVRTFKATNGHVTCGQWWQTLDGRQIAIIATNAGEISFIDLLNDKVCKELILDMSISDLSLSFDDLQLNTTLLITTPNGGQWRLMLESRIAFSRYSPDMEISDMSYENIDTYSIPPCTILDSAEDDTALFTPTRFQNFQPPTLLRPQYARGHHFITAHCKLSSTLQVLDSDAEHSPLFVYKLPVGADNVILTDKLIFAVIAHSRDRKLMILSNQKSENSVDEHQDFSNEAIVQEFTLPEGEHLISVERKRYPFYYHEHHESELSKRVRSGSITGSAKGLELPVLDIPVTTHTVLDGCIIVTDCSVYEIRPRISPERLFLHLALTLPETTSAENLAISIGLDLTTLSELAADFMLKQSCFSKALKLYTLSKCSATRRTAGLARHGCISETMIHLRQVLSSSNFELNTSERKYLSNMLLHCFIYQLNNPGQATANIRAGLSDFLLGSFSFDEKSALNLLSDYGEVELLLTFAKARGLVVDALNSLVKFQTFSAVPFSALNDLVQRGFTAHLIQSGLGSLLPCLPPEDIVQLLITRPQLAIQNYSLLRQLVPSLKYDQLLELARIFDPSKSVMRGTLVRLQGSRRRANSLTSLYSTTSETMDSTQDQMELRAESLIKFFLLVVVHLNHCRRQSPSYKLPALTFSSIVSSPADSVKDVSRDKSSGEVNRKLSVQFQPVSCGPKHSAVVRNGDLYTWGRSQQGRLGHGELSQSVCPPMRVETLHMLQLKVDAVACGNEHTLALTQQGVYGWGSSKYGQVGVGTRHIYRRPMLLETLQSETTVAVECGHYHSLALTTDNQVYSWGWGVHGQLGHGHPEDCLIPTHVHHLLNMGVVKLSAGYAHTVVLTESGDVWTFGCGYFGQLGLGTNNKSSVPQKVDLPDGQIVAIATKYFHSVAISVDNKVFLWGLHPHSLRQVASSLRSSKHAGVYVPEQTSYLLPAEVETTYVHGKIIKVCCGSLHTILLSDDGGLFVWGRNLEGQLGTGSRQDERMPKMLTSINDQHIISVASGGEFNIAFDAEGGLWVWGKNESGQLGYARTRKDNQKNYRLSGPSLSRSMSSQGHASEINTPTALKGLPQSDVSNPHWMSVLASIQNENLWMDNLELESEYTLDHVPDLGDLGDEVYDSSVVPVTLKTLDNICETSFCLQKCVDLGDWQTAGHISCIDDNIVQALYYRMRLVTERVGHMEHEEIISLCAQLIEHHIRLVQELTPAESGSNKDLQQLCSHALYCWQMYNFPTEKLEAIFSEHLSELAPWFIEVVLRQSSEEQSAQSPGSPFSTHFSLRVLKAVMSLSTASRGSSKWDRDWLEMLEGTTICDSLLQKSVNQQHQGKQTPRDRLWTDILRNMKKEMGAITLTSSQLEHLSEAQLRNGDLQNASKIIVFTCGHHYTDASFHSEALTALNRALTGDVTKLPKSASLLKDILSQPGLKASACPKCILQGILDT